MATRITHELWAVLVDARDEIERLNAKIEKVAAALALIEFSGSAA